MLLTHFELVVSTCCVTQGIQVPLSLSAPREVKDKMGASSLAFDVAMNTKVVENCQADKTGAFRNFVCELAIKNIDQKV